jgi:uncharacterized protein DUF4168
MLFRTAGVPPALDHERASKARAPMTAMADLEGRPSFKGKEHPNQTRKFDMQPTTGFYAFCAITLAAAGLLVGPAATAQQQSPAAPSPTAPAPTTAPATISDNKLDATAAAVKKVTALRDTYEQKLAQAPAAEKQRLAGEATDAMEKAVTEQGLSIEEYTAILKVAQNDPVVRGKLIQRMK